MKEEEQRRKYPSNRLLKFLIRLRESGLLRSMPGNYLKVLNVLLSYRNEHGYCWPSRNTIAAKAGVSEATVKRAISYFIACIGITKKRGDKKVGFTNIYKIPFDETISIQNLPKRGVKRKLKKEKVEILKNRHRGVTGEPPALGSSIDPGGGSNENRRKNTLKEVEGVLRSTTSSLTKREKPKRQRSKIDTGEKAWSKIINALEEKIKNKQEAKP